MKNRCASILNPSAKPRKEPNDSIFRPCPPVPRVSSLDPFAGSLHRSLWWTECSRRADKVETPSVDAAVARGLDFLAAQQNPDGSFGANQKPAITGLALLSFLACGHAPNAGKLEPNVGKYGSIVRAAIDSLLAEAQPDGSFGHREKMMYGQAIATLALAESYGVDDNDAERKRTAAVLGASVKLMIAAQNVKKQDIYAGGWRYDANSPDSDLSVSGWCVLALRACQDVGIAVPAGTPPRAAKFVLKCYNADAKGFAYQPGGPAQASMNAVAIVCLHALDGGPRPEVETAIAALTLKPLDEAAAYPFHGMYCAAHAALQSGDLAWQAVSKIIIDSLLKSQQPDGGWPDTPESAGAGRAYCTCMAVLTLSMPYRLAPTDAR